MSRTERSNLTLRQSTPPDIVDESSSSSPVSSPLEEEEFNYEGLDRESGGTEDEVVTRNTANMDTARPLTFSPQPSTSREEEEPSTSRQADVRDVETNDITIQHLARYPDDPAYHRHDRPAANSNSEYNLQLLGDSHLSCVLVRPAHPTCEVYVRGDLLKRETI
ncbi:hypothetical protein C0Q70_20815 [Pomacea canaliculata]|uniref:Uncharacterized protein n=1 Tax=Pomacea canaliculata TaxID=400727 RepID=A0A2T7NAR8_POMCA|nr:hypothetical protein C0Q70_20815 [Pomacea canaliculata]